MFFVNFVQGTEKLHISKKCFIAIFSVGRIKENVFLFSRLFTNKIN